jgi:hypothetical protein
MKNIVVLLGLIVSVAVLAGCTSTFQQRAMEQPVAHHDYKGEG